LLDQAIKNGHSRVASGSGPKRRQEVEDLALLLAPQVPPSIREDGRKANVSGMAGQSLMLECDASGFPVPEVMWFKDGQLVSVPGKDGVQVGVPWEGWAAGGIWIGNWPSG
jgi:hypothetical protein